MQLASAPRGARIVPDMQGKDGTSGGPFGKVGFTREQD